MEYVQLEQSLLPQDLLALRPPYATYTPASAAAEAKGDTPFLLPCSFQAAKQHALSDLHSGISLPFKQRLAICFDF